MIHAEGLRAAAGPPTAHPLRVIRLGLWLLQRERASANGACCCCAVIGVGTLPPPAFSATVCMRTKANRAPAFSVPTCGPSPRPIGDLACPLHGNSAPGPVRWQPASTQFSAWVTQGEFSSSPRACRRCRLTTAWHVPSPPAPRRRHAAPAQPTSGRDLRRAFAAAAAVGSVGDQVQIGDAQFPSPRGGQEPGQSRRIRTCPANYACRRSRTHRVLQPAAASLTFTSLRANPGSSRLSARRSSHGSTAPAPHRFARSVENLRGAFASADATSSSPRSSVCC